jgi:hypothetical protein
VLWKRDDVAQQVADDLGWPDEDIDVSDEIASLECKMCQYADKCHGDPVAMDAPCLQDVVRQYDGGDSCEFCGDPDDCESVCGVRFNEDGSVTELRDEPGLIRKSHADLIKERPVRPSNHWFPGVIDVPGQEGVLTSDPAQEVTIVMFINDASECPRECPVDCQCWDCTP